MTWPRGVLSNIRPDRQNPDSTANRTKRTSRMANQDIAPLSLTVERDLRLDLFRGIGLWMIFLDHIPDDFVSWLTLRNYGFSDAAEAFVFISGYLAGYIYGPIIASGNFLAALKRLWTRVWQMYVAHIMLFLLFTAQIARTIRKFDNPMYADEFNVHNFLQHPDILIGQALTMRYKPVDLDVLPLYIALVAASPLILWCLLRRPNWTLLGSILLYIGARVALAVAFAWMAFAFLIVMTWHSAFLESLVPKWMIKAIYPIDKTDLDMLRFTHFLALATFVTLLISRKWKPLNSIWLRPMILCGQHSLPIFCISVLLSFSAHWILTQYTKGAWEQLAVSAAGILIMVVIAWFLNRAAKVPDLFVRVTESSQPEVDAG